MLELLRSLDQTVLIFGAVFTTVVVLSAVAGAFVVVARFGPRANFRKRLNSVIGKPVGRSGERSGPESSRRKEIQDKLKEFEDDQKAKKPRRNEIRDAIQQAGLEFTVRQYAIGSVGIGFVAFLLTVFFVGFGLGGIVGGLLAGVAVGLGVPKFALNHMRGRRLKKFIKLFPDAIDVIVRGIQSGLPVGECLAIIARETSEPMGGEFRRIIEGIHIGLTLDECLERAVTRVPLADLRFFAIVLQIQQQTGGNLAETLSNLSGVLRDRKKMKDKVAAMSAEAKASAMIIGALPPIVAGMLGLANPEYIGLLFSRDLGIYMLIGGALWMSLGVFVMKQMINFEI